MCKPSIGPITHWKITGRVAEKIRRKVEVVEIFKQIIGAGPLPPR